MFGRWDPETKQEIPSSMELLRMALPRRTHTQSHIDYVLEVAKEVLERKKKIRGLKITHHPTFLMYFTADFEPL